MKRLLIVGLLIAHSLIYSGNVFAYEVLTHQAMSVEALRASILATDPSLLPNLGLLPLSEEQTFFDPTLLENATISEIIQRGAEQEDNARGSRFIHHFYDPVYNEPLNPILLYEKALLSSNYGWLTDPLKSPDWALEDNEDISVQRFSFKDARRGFFDALTKNTKEERESAISFTFRTLGHVIHHIQDMAQPQHTKNEKHPLEPASLYEHFTERDDVRKALPYSGYAPVFSPESGKDHTTFNTARKFWLTGTQGNGKGLAEFTNWNFVTYGHNFTGLLNEILRDPRYPHPDGMGAQVWSEDVHIVPQVAINNNIPPALLGKVYYIRKPVDDKYLNTTEINDRASTFSLYDVDLQQFHLKVPSCTGIPNPCETEAVFSVNRATMRAAHAFLIPRAVAYSAGLINYFFRGKIDVVEEGGLYIIKNDGTEPLKGTFTLYYDDQNGNRHPVLKDAQGNAIGWKTEEQDSLQTDGGMLVAGASMPLPPFSLPTNPTPKTAGEYMLVFQGDMGEEKAPRDAQGKLLAGGAVAAKQIEIAPPGFLTPTHRLWYANGGWQAAPVSAPQYGTTDWQSGGTVLSWDGPRGRLVRPLRLEEMTTHIYRNGAIFAEAPGPVMGAALTKGEQIGIEPQQDRFLVVVVAEVQQFDNVWTGRSGSHIVGDHVYVRHLPDGAWQEIGMYRYPAPVSSYGLQPEDVFSAAWFFNAEGNAAVSNKLAYGSDSNQVRDRRPLRLQISAGHAVFTDITQDDPILPDIEDLYHFLREYTISDYLVDYRDNTLIHLAKHFRESVDFNYIEGEGTFGTVSTLVEFIVEGVHYIEVQHSRILPDGQSDYSISRGGETLHVDLRIPLVWMREWDEIDTQNYTPLIGRDSNLYIRGVRHQIYRHVFDEGDYSQQIPFGSFTLDPGRFLFEDVVLTRFPMVAVLSPDTTVLVLVSEHFVTNVNPYNQFEPTQTQTIQRTIPDGTTSGFPTDWGRVGVQ